MTKAHLTPRRTEAESTAPDSAPADSPTTMKAVVLDRFGGIEELVPREIAVPELAAGDVLIKVEYAGAGSWDAEEREGDYDGAFGVPSTFPYVLGWDGAGTVAATGRDVTRFVVGDRVYAATTPVTRGGFYAEYGVVEEEFVARVPDRLPMSQAGAMPWDALTALSGLDVLAPHPGQSLMVFGASGGIGHMAVQLARSAGLRVLAIASGDDGVALAQRLGADAAIDGRRDDVLAAAAEFAPDGLDGALVTAGGSIAEQALAAVKASGTIAWPNGVYPELASSPAATVTRYDGDRSRAATDRLNEAIETGDLEVHIASTFPLERARDAHEAMGKHYVGKQVLQVS